MKGRGRSRGSAPRLRAGEAVAGGGAVILLAAMFLPWYDIGGAGQKDGFRDLIVVSVGRDAWQTLDMIAVILGLALAAVLALVLVRVLGSSWRPPIAPGAIIAVLGGLATLLILLRILLPPSFDLGLELDVTPAPAAFIGLAAALAMACGGYRAMYAEGTSFAGVADSLKRHPRQREGGRAEGMDAGRAAKRAP